jgi:hypothetical protein
MRIRPSENRAFGKKPISHHACAMSPSDRTALPLAFSEYLTWIKAKIASSPI